MVRVGGTKNPDVARILALAPDLVFANAEENRKEDVEALARTLPVDVSHPRGPEEVPALLRLFGERTERSAAAEEWARRVEERLAARLRAAAPFRYAVLIWKDPWMTTGGRTYIDGLLRGAGGVDVFAREAPDYPQVEEAELASAAPDVLLLPDEPYRFGEAHAAFWRERLPRTEVRLVAGDDLCWHGVRTLRGLELTDDLVRSLPPRR